MIVKMTETYAREIVSWKYEKPYDYCNMTDAYDELMASYHAILSGELIGYMCSGLDAQVPPGNYPEGYVDIGFGMKPDLCGQRRGKAFMEEIMAYYDLPLRLTVLVKNERAIKLYKKMGFSEIERFYRGEREFIIMTQ